MVGLALDPGIGQIDARRFEPGEWPGRALRELPIGAVDLDLGDRERRRAAGAHPDRDALGPERHPLDHQALDRRRALGQPVERAQAEEAADQQREQRERQQRGRPGAGHASSSATSKKLIQPSSTNSV